MLEGWIKLYRQILFSDIFKKKSEYLKIFIYILLKVNHSDGMFEKGSNFFNFEEEKKLIPFVTLNQIYEFLRWAKSEKVKILTTQKTTRGVIIKLNKWESFQGSENEELQDTLQVNYNSTTSQLQDSYKSTTSQLQDDKQECKNERMKECKNVEVVEETTAASADSSLNNSSSDLTPEEFRAECENWYGEFENVHLTKKQYMKLLGITMSEKGLKMAISQLSEKIAGKKAELYDENFPEMHYVAVNSFWKYIKENPAKFYGKTIKSEAKAAPQSLTDFANELDEEGYLEE